MNIFYKIKLYLHLLRYRGLKEKLHYSRWGEDSFLINYFKDTSSGRYIDIGAFHPFRGSNTHLLYKKGWTFSILSGPPRFTNTTAVFIV